MRRFLLFLAGLCSCQFSFAQFDGDQLFDQSYLHEIRIHSPVPDFYDAMVDELYLNFYDVPYLPASVTIDGHQVDSVGVRIKGALSAFAFKKSFKLDFNKFVSGGAFDGVKKLNLQNSYFDATLQREALAYDIFREAGVKAPRTAFAEVYINDELHGLYILVEQVDKNFLRNYFADDEGTLYKNKIGILEVAAGDDDFSFIDELNAVANISDDDEFAEAIEQIMDTESFLRYMMIEVFIHAVDNPITVDQNYYIYHEPKSGLLAWIPWDFNFALWPGSNFPLLFENSGNGLFNKMLRHPTYRKRYLDLACHFLQVHLMENKLHDLVDYNFNLIADAVAADPRHDFYDYDFVEETLNMKDLFSNRVKVFMGHLLELNHYCPVFFHPDDFDGISINEFMASNDSSSNIVDPAGGHADWIEIYNGNSHTVSLKDCYLSDDRDFKKHWRFQTDAVIPPNDYLIVWADRDVDEDGLHADFKLNKDTGEIYLIYERGFVIDSISYGQQITNVPYARIPNGAGDFIFHQSTLGENNENITSLENEINILPKIKIAPNPTAGALTIKIENKYAGLNKTINIYNAFGQKVYATNSLNSFIKINLPQLINGIYFLEIKMADFAHAEKFFVRH